MLIINFPSLTPSIVEGEYVIITAKFSDSGPRIWRFPRFGAWVQCLKVQDFEALPALTVSAQRGKCGPLPGRSGELRQWVNDVATLDMLPLRYKSSKHSRYKPWIAKTCLPQRPAVPDVVGKGPRKTGLLLSNMV